MRCTIQLYHHPSLSRVINLAHSSPIRRQAQKSIFVYDDDDGEPHERKVPKSRVSIFKRQQGGNTRRVPFLHSNEGSSLPIASPLGRLHKQPWSQAPLSEDHQVSPPGSRCQMG